MVQLQQELTQSQKECNLYQEKESALIMQMEEIEADLAETQKRTYQVTKEKKDLEQEVGK